MPTIRIILRAQETKNLEYVANTIVKLAKEKQFVVRGPKPLPNTISNNIVSAFLKKSVSTSDGF